MTRKSSKGYTYYSCSTYKKKSKEHCTKHSIREDVLEKAVLLTIQKQIQLVEDLNGLVEEIGSAPLVHTASKRIDGTLVAKKRELQKLESISDTLYMDWRTGEITKEEYRRIKEKYKSQVEQLQAVITNLEEEKVALEKGIKSNEPYFEMFMKHKNITHLERGLLVELVDTIYVHENGALTIMFRFADQYKKIMEYIENNRKENVFLHDEKTG